MKHSCLLSAMVLAVALPVFPVSGASAAVGSSLGLQTEQAAVSADFRSSEAYRFTAGQEARILGIMEETYRAVNADFPALAEHVAVTIVPVDRDLSAVGHVSGRSDAPGVVLVEISISGDGGVDAAIADGLDSAFVHELHHLVRGWTISGNRFGHGIAIAAANEGLAVAYAEILTGKSYPGNTPPAADVAIEWALEIRALPLRANYGEWMFAHPDGRVAVGYRTGAFIVRRAMENSSRDIVDLSTASPEEIWELAEID
jgi:hypothetical protein